MSTDLARLIRRARRGEEAAITALVEAHQAPVYHLCYRLLGNSGEAEEAAQETFMRAFQHLRAYDPRRPFKTWLFAIASHYCIDRLRRQHWRLCPLEDEPAYTHPALCEPAPGPEEVIAGRERDRAVQRLLAELPPKDRRVIVLRYWAGLSYAEIARLTGATLSAVKSRLHRARAALAQLWVGAPSERPAYHPLRPPLPARS